MNLINSSDLIIKKFYITNTTLLSIFPESGQRIRLSTLKIAGDFDIFTSVKKEDEYNFIVNFNIKCNEEEKPGYYFDIGAVGEFTLKDTENLREKIEQQYVLYTALPMVINSLRIYLQNITAMHAFGTYLLPTLDLNELIKSKFSNNEEIADE